MQLRTRDVKPEAIGLIVVEALKQAQEALLKGALLTIDANKHRVSLLPLLRK